ncbi:RNAse III [Curtobacterium sp. PhB130]|uniref:ribonuclease III n=1 Tax=unclassified Curtobacterium TaxID=257496 RepID=UPI000F4BF8DB|nr:MULTISPECIES: ribonuclease III [unclassified Curtobacterium]ROP66548.1 RNAse III [Curtobacterium sp. ZW137]ROS72005.1 RNAse III [Curtobacterium sp. PhB130]TCK61424.1 RNAse III [Curtobacterium sp. PhB136]
MSTTSGSAGSNPAGSDVARLRDLLGVPVDPELLQLALTHRSFAYEHGGIKHNERLEFLGDSILGQAVTVKLYRDFPDLDEGDLAKRRASLVSTVALAEIARINGLGAFLRLGKGEEQTGGRDKSSILADTVEAIIGATYLSAGPDEATALVLRLVEPLLIDPDRFGAAMDPKTSLQELASAQSLGNPAYRVTEEGPDHDKTFHATVVLQGEDIASGSGSSKKTAEMSAALDAWTRLSGRTSETPAA